MIFWDECFIVRLFINFNIPKGLPRKPTNPNAAIQNKYKDQYKVNIIHWLPNSVAKITN